MIDFERIEEMVEQDAVPTDAALGRVAETVRLQQDLEKRVAELDEALSEAKRDLRRVSEIDLPEAMRAAGGITRVDLEGGLRVEVKPYYEAAISREHADAAFAWLRDNNHADLIKHEVRLGFGRGEDEVARYVVDDLRGRGLEPEEKTTVHPQTLKAFVREQMEAGQDLPHDLLGIHAGQRAKVTVAK